jgi:hypothetical protein
MINDFASDAVLGLDTAALQRSFEDEALKNEFVNSLKYRSLSMRSAQTDASIGMIGVGLVRGFPLLPANESPVRDEVLRESHTQNRTPFFARQGATHDAHTD